MSYHDPRDHDPQFPHRPQHPDLHLLSDIAQGLDIQAEAGVPVILLVGVDEESLMYYLMNRIGTHREQAQKQLGIQVPESLLPFLMAIYTDALSVGIRMGEARART